MSSDLQLDLVTVIARIEQVHGLPEGPLREMVLERLFTCDAPRLRGHLDDEGQQLLAGAS